MLGGCVAFSWMSLCIGAAHRVEPGLSTMVASAVRAVVNLAVLVVIAKGSLRALFGDGRPALWVRGITGAVALLTFFGSLSTLDVGEASFLNQTSAVWVAILAPVLLGERTRAWTWVAITGSLIGMALLAHPRPEAGDFTARLLGLASGLSASGAYLAIRRAGTTNTPLTIIFYFTLLSTIAATTWVLIAGAPLPEKPLTWVCLVGSGVAATFGQMAMTRAYQIAPAAPMAATSAASPLLTTVLGWALLQQTPDQTGMIGMVLLLICAVALPLVS